LDKSLPHEVRFLAIIQLKNGVEKYWRLNSHITHGLKAQEKALIRSRLFQGTIEELDKTLALHNSLSIAKVVRIDYPQEWPEALPSIAQLLRAHKDGNQEYLHGALQIVLRVVKELGTARLRRSQTALQTITPELTRLLAEIYTEKTALWVTFLTKNQGDEDAADLAMANSLLCVKSLRRLLTTGYDTPYRDETVSTIWRLTQDHFAQFLNYVKQDSSVPWPYQDLIGRHLLQFSKLHIDMSDSHASSFAVLPNSLPLVRAYWDLVANFAEVFDKSGGIRQTAGEASQAKSKFEGPLLERLALKGLVLLRTCVRIAHRPTLSFKYRSEEAKKAREQAVHMIKAEWLTPEFITQVTNVLITQLFVFRQSDLDAWEEDPEDWEHQEQADGSAYEWEVRPCAERLFVDFLSSYKDILIPPLLDYFKSTTVDGTDVPKKEAVYTAMGLAAHHIIQAVGTGASGVDFDALLSTTLVHDAQQQGPLAKVLRRRIAILLSQWIAVQSTEGIRPIIYELFRHFLNPNDEANDIVVRITAARQLRWVVDELAFDVDKFLPFMSDILVQLVGLVQRAEVDDTKLAILETIRILVSRFDTKINEFGDFIMTALPQIWAHGNEEFLIKQAIVAIFTSLVLSMGTDSQRYQQHMLPLIAQGAQAGSDIHTSLLDECLELWNSVLVQTKPPLSPDLINLLELALPLLEYTPESSVMALGIVEAYLLLAPHAGLEDRFRRPILAALDRVLGCQAREKVRVATVCIEYIVRAAAELGGTGGVNAIIQDMLEVGMLKRILGDLHDAWEANQTTGPLRKLSKISTVTEGDLFAILARLALVEPNSFVLMLSSFGPIDAVWNWLADEWFRYNADQDNIDRQKLYLLALTRLLELPDPVQAMTLGKLQDYFNLWNNVVTELRDGVEVPNDCLVWAELPEDEWPCPKNTAEAEMGMKDPIHSVVAIDFVKVRLQSLVERVGGEAVFAETWAVNVDQDVLATFRRLS
jgi:hypothetical protein